MKNYKKIVLTGGPCGGKTQGANFLKTELKKFEINVIIVSEAAEKLIKSGYNRNNDYDFQKSIANYQIKLENEAEEIANKTENSLIICDRGLIDGKVYLNDSEFEKLCTELDMNEILMRDRYDGAFHLDSVSENESYVNSEIRIEKPKEAEILNLKSLKVWCGNPHYRFIPVCKTFEEKMEILLKEVMGFIGIPKPLEIERKYLIEMPDTNFLLTRCCSKVNIIQHYLQNENERFRIRARGVGNSYIYTKTTKHKNTDFIYEEIEKNISKEEYEIYLSSYIVSGSISKDRYCLMENGTYFEIDIFPFWKKQCYMEVELLEENQKIIFPEYIKILEDVTEKREYKNSSLSKYAPKEII